MLFVGPSQRRDVSDDRNKYTNYMILHELRYLIEYQALEVKFPYPSFQAPRAMSNDPNDLLHKHLIRRDLSIPAVDTLFDKDGNDGI